MEKNIHDLPAASKTLWLRKPLFPKNEDSESDDESQLTDADIEIEVSEPDEEHVLEENATDADGSFQIDSENVFEEQGSEAVDDGRWTNVSPR